MNVSMACGCLGYPCIHTQLGGMGQMSQSLYNEMLRQSAGLQNMHSIQPAVTPKETEKKRNKKLLLLRK